MEPVTEILNINTVLEESVGFWKTRPAIATSKSRPIMPRSPQDRQRFGPTAAGLSQYLNNAIDATGKDGKIISRPGTWPK